MSLVSLSLWSIMAWNENLFGLFVILEDECGSWVNCDIVGCTVFSVIIGCKSLLFDMYYSLSVRFCM